MALSGDEGDRTPNPCLAKAVLSQLSYVPGINPGWEYQNVFDVDLNRPPLSDLNQISGRAKIRTWDLVVISDAL